MFNTHKYDETLWFPSLAGALLFCGILSSFLIWRDAKSAYFGFRNCVDGQNPNKCQNQIHITKRENERVWARVGGSVYNTEIPPSPCPRLTVRKLSLHHFHYSDSPTNEFVHVNMYVFISAVLIKRHSLFKRCR